MNDNRNPLYRAVRNALFTSATASLFISAGIASAQDQSNDEGTEQLERLEVTGSRIKRTDVEGANPVVVLTREEILKTKATNIGELLQRITQNSGSPLTTTTNNGNNGLVTIDLRGFGGRTLVLINGRRIVDGGDLQTIPAAMLERIEILNTGASAIYGADAVAGVVNFITRTDFTGAELSYDYSTPENIDGDASNATVSGIIGISGDKGQVNMGFQWQRQNGAIQGDFPDPFLPSSFFIVDLDSFNQDGPQGFSGNPAFTEIGSSRIPEGRFNFADGRVLDHIAGHGISDPVNDFQPASGTYNYAPVNFLQTPFERKNVWANGKYDVAEHVTAYMEARWSLRTSEQQLAPVPFDTGIGDPGFPLPGGGNGISADNAFNPFGENITRVRRRLVETGRTFFQNRQQFQAVLGLQGDIPWTDTWDYDVSYNYGQRVGVDTDIGQLAGSRLELGLGPSFFDADGNAVCGTPANPIANTPGGVPCVPLNFFGGPGTITPEMAAFMSVPLTDKFVATQEIWNATITGDVYELPAGVISTALGGEFRTETSNSVPDSGKILRTVSGNKAGAIQGRQEIISGFGEAVVPVLSDMFLAQTLEIDLGFRYDRFKNTSFGRPTNTFSSTVWQGGFRWQPVQSVLVRGTWAQVFTAPSVGALFAPQADNFPSVTDPCADNNIATLSAAAQQHCFAQGVPPTGLNTDPTAGPAIDTQVRAITGGNPDLTAETGTTRTIGIVWSPDFVDGLQITADWWQIRLVNAISGLSAQNTLDTCAENLDPSICGLITRDLTGSVIGSPGEVVQVLTANSNIGSETGRGLDLEGSYSLNTDYGFFKSRVNWTHILSRQTQVFVGGAKTELKGTFGDDPGGDSAFVKDKVNATIDWSYSDFSVTYGLQYIGPITAPISFIAGRQSISSEAYHDFSASYNLVDYNTEFTVGVTNFTDNGPPFIDFAFNGSTDESTYRVLGRTWFARVSHTF